MDLHWALLDNVLWDRPQTTWDIPIQIGSSHDIDGSSHHSKGIPIETIAHGTSNSPLGIPRSNWGIPHHYGNDHVYHIRKACIIGVGTPSRASNRPVKLWNDRPYENSYTPIPSARLVRPPKTLQQHGSSCLHVCPCNQLFTCKGWAHKMKQNWACWGCREPANVLSLPQQLASCQLHQRSRANTLPRMPYYWCWDRAGINMQLLWPNCEHISCSRRLFALDANSTSFFFLSLKLLKDQTWWIYVEFTLKSISACQNHNYGINGQYTQSQNLSRMAYELTDDSTPVGIKRTVWCPNSQAQLGMPTHTIGMHQQHGHSQKHWEWPFLPCMEGVVLPIFTSNGRSQL